METLAGHGAEFDGFVFMCFMGSCGSPRELSWCPRSMIDPVSRLYDRISFIW